MSKKGAGPAVPTPLILGSEVRGEFVQTNYSSLITHYSLLITFHSSLSSVNP